MNIDSLPSELFSHILFFIDGPVRLALRLSNRALEEKVAQSDLHVPSNSYKQKDVTLHTVSYEGGGIHLGTIFIRSTDSLCVLRIANNL